MNEEKNEAGATTLRLDLGNQLHWHNSSNVLCNYMREQRFLDMILMNRAIIPRYVIEPLDYLDLKPFPKICFPMTCFCDIPFSKVLTHMSNYGSYGVALDKESAYKKYHVQPIQYISEYSPLVKDFKAAFLTSISNHFEGDAKVLTDYLASALLYMKPIRGDKINDQNIKVQYIYQDECEWRFIPTDNFPKELHLILKPSETTEKGKEKYSDALKNHQECWLKFEWNELLYIIVPDESAAKHTIETIKSLAISEDEKETLIAKIEIIRRILDNF